MHDIETKDEGGFAFVRAITEAGQAVLDKGIAEGWIETMSSAITPEVLHHYMAPGSVSMLGERAREAGLTFMAG